MSDQKTVMKAPARVNILGVGISAVNLAQAIRLIEHWIQGQKRCYINLCVVHTLMECRRTPRLRQIVNNSDLATPDGMPLVWLSHLRGYPAVGRVYGPDLMLALCERSVETGYRHYFYGGKPGVAELLGQRLANKYPGLQVAGTFSPPFRPNDSEEKTEVIQQINEANPDIIWVGLGTPKQDFWIARHRPLLQALVLIAVGAAFDIHAGLLPQAPPWMRRSGLEWLFRLVQEPRRLAYRYLIYNPLFLWHVLLQLTGLRRYSLEDKDETKVKVEVEG